MTNAERVKKWRAEHPGRAREINRQVYANNIEHYRKYQREYRRAYRARKKAEKETEA